MIYLTDKPPSYCPACARVPVLSSETRSRFYSGYLQACRCGAQFHHLPHDHILQIVGKSPRSDAN